MAKSPANSSPPTCNSKPITGAEEWEAVAAEEVDKSRAEDHRAGVPRTEEPLRERESHRRPTTPATRPAISETAQINGQSGCFNATIRTATACSTKMKCPRLSAPSSINGTPTKMALSTLPNSRPTSRLMCSGAWPKTAVGTPGKEEAYLTAL